VGDPGGVAATIASGVSGPIGFSGRGDRAGIRADDGGHADGMRPGSSDGMPCGS